MAVRLAVLALTICVANVDASLIECLGFGGFELMLSTLEQAKPCLLNYKANAHDMLVTLENLYFGSDEIYSFADIAKDSLASTQKNKCGLGVHKVKVDLQTELKSVEQEFLHPSLRALGLTEFRNSRVSPQQAHELLFADLEVSVFDFHLRLREIFTQLHDAHTRYVFPSFVFVVLPVKFGLRKNDLKGSVEVTAQGSVEASMLTEKSGTSGVHCSEEESDCVLDSIDGTDPLEWLQRVADDMGLYHDKGQRLNALLLQKSDGGFKDMLALMVGVDSGFPTSNPVLKFRSPAVPDQTLEWLTVIDPYKFDKTMGPNPAYQLLQKFEKRRFQYYRDRSAECAEIPACNQSFAKSRPSSPVLARAYARALPSYPSEFLEEMIELAAERHSAQSVPKELASRGDATSHTPLVLEGVESHASQGVAEALTTRMAAAPKLQENKSQAWENAAEALASRRLKINKKKSSKVPLEQTLNLKSKWEGSDDNPEPSCLKKSDPSYEPIVEMTELVPGLGETELVTVTAVGDAVIFKLKSFGTKIGDFSKIVSAFGQASEYAKSHGQKRILFDVIGNGGGLVLLTDALQSMVLRESDPRSLCNWYNKHFPKYWRLWVESFGEGIESHVEKHMEFLNAQADLHPFPVVQWFAKWAFTYLWDLMYTSNEVLIQLDPACEEQPDSCVVDLRAIEETQEVVQRATTKEEILLAAEKLLKAHKFIPDALYGSTVKDGQRVSSRDGWFPFTGDQTLDPNTANDFVPRMEAYMDPLTEDWGGIVSNYTKHGMFVTCALVAGVDAVQNLKYEGLIPLDVMAESLYEHPFEDVAILSDGLAGSAASAFVSRLQSSGKVTVFTYGGTGEIMDSSAFAGGNIEEYQAWWPKVALAAELGQWLLPDSEWERYALKLSENGPGHHKKYPTYPYAMPTQATSSFNLNMMYIKEFASPEDDGYSLLPREFYRFPAHKHYEQWPRYLADTCENTDELVRMYNQILAEKWCNVRASPQFEDNGWDRACTVPADECPALDLVPLTISSVSIGGTAMPWALLAAAAVAATFGVASMWLGSGRSSIRQQPLFG